MGEGMHWITRNILDPFAKHVLAHFQIAYCLGNRHTLFP